MRAVFSLFLLGVLLFPRPCLAAEEILSFGSRVTVGHDGGLAVTESIRVRSEGARILHGIYRDFPTDYRDRAGNRVRVGFDVVSVARDGKPEPWHREGRGNGVRIYFGSGEVDLPPGEHLYEFSYRTDRQVGFFPDHDELFWNATGDGWEFPILDATALVTLPPGIAAGEVRVEGYTGPRGSVERSLTAGLDGSGRPVFVSTRVLAPGEGMSIVVGFPKGVVMEPTGWDRAVWFARDNRGALAGLLGLVVVLGYYLWGWFREGRDPARGVAVPRWEPPFQLPPEAMRYVMKMGYDDRAFTAAVLDMAVKGYLVVEQEGSVFTLRRKPGGDEGRLSPAQRKAAKFLFPPGAESLPLTASSHRELRNAQGFAEEELKAGYNGTAFRLNRGYLGPGMGISAAAVVLAVLLSPGQAAPALFMLLWLSGWAFGTGMLWLARKWFMALVFTGFLLAGIFALAQTASLLSGVLLLLLAGVNALFSWLMKAPTRAGRRMMDGIEGFRMYLAAAEEDRLNLMNPPEKTPDLFERYLPYALALEVDQQWSEKFAAVLAQASASPGSGGVAYAPYWYRGAGWGASSPAAFASGLGSSLSSAISSSSTPPGSSSGFGGGGGGGSGGGGGGGGGGGW